MYTENSPISTEPIVMVGQWTSFRAFLMFVRLFRALKKQKWPVIQQEAECFGILSTKTEWQVHCELNDEGTHLVPISVLCCV